MHSKGLRDLILKKREENWSYSKISNLFSVSRHTVASICKRRGNIKQKCGPKRKISEKTGRKIRRSVQKMINFNEKVTARKVILENNLSVSKRTMQRHLSDSRFKYGSIKKQIFLTKKHKIARVKILQNWLKARMDFNRVVMTDEKFFSLGRARKLVFLPWGKRK